MKKDKARTKKITVRVLFERTMEKMDLDILARICYVLECDPADLIRYEHP